MCCFHVNGRPFRHIFHYSQNLPASCERSLDLRKCFVDYLFRGPKSSVDLDLIALAFSFVKHASDSDKLLVVGELARTLEYPEGALSDEVRLIVPRKVSSRDSPNKLMTLASAKRQKKLLSLISVASSIDENQEKSDTM